MATESKLHNVYMLFRDSVTKMVASIVPSKEVEDILQETYVRICQLPEPESIEKPKSFLYTTARNLAFDHLKRAETRLTDELQEESEAHGLGDVTFEQAVSQKEFSLFCEAVRDLPPQCRRVFVLKKVYGYSQKEIADVMKISQSTVEKHIATGIKKCTLFMRKQNQKSGNTTTPVTKPHSVIKPTITPQINAGIHAGARNGRSKESDLPSSDNRQN